MSKSMITIVLVSVNEKPCASMSFIICMKLMIFIFMSFMKLETRRIQINPSRGIMIRPLMMRIPKLV